MLLPHLPLPTQLPLFYSDPLTLKCNNVYIYSHFIDMSIETKRPIRVLVAKVGLDGHDRGAKVIATALRDAGMEVIYTGLRQTPEMVVNTAIQEDVDVIGISILSGAHNTVFPNVRELMDKKGLNDVLLTGGGIIPEEDMVQLQMKGTGKLFGPSSPTSAIADYIREWVVANRNDLF
jgi:methylmalonyl-CoA mutase, C-terminal domain